MLAPEALKVWSRRCGIETSELVNSCVLRNPDICRHTLHTGMIVRFRVVR